MLTISHLFLILQEKSFRHYDKYSVILVMESGNLAGDLFHYLLRNITLGKLHSLNVPHILICLMRHFFNLTFKSFSNSLWFCNYHSIGCGRSSWIPKGRLDITWYHSLWNTLFIFCLLCLLQDFGWMPPLGPCSFWRH